MNKIVGIIALTEDRRIVRSNSADLKKIGQWKDWYCDIGKVLVCLNQIKKIIYFSECGNQGTTCTKSQCWCGADIEIPKAIDEKTLEEFRNIFIEYDKTVNIKHWNGTDKIIAVAAADLLLNNSLHVDWTITKKCNYDCSYCPPSVHDNFSPYPSFLDCKSFFESALLNNNLKLSDYKFIRVTLTGGEPTIMKEFSELIDWLKEFSEPNIVTNFTSSLEDLISWHRYSRYMITMHHEYNTEKKTEKLLRFLNETPYRNFVGIKYFVNDESYKEVSNILKKIDEHHKWTKIRIYPLIDKTNSNYKILVKQ